MAGTEPVTICHDDHGAVARRLQPSTIGATLAVSQALGDIRTR